MQLISTADTRLWVTAEPALFLGEWCRRAADEAVWSAMQARVVPYHWDDRAKLYADYLDLERRYEELLPQLAQRLNELHRTSFSLRYWRLVAGAWLRLAMSIVWDRLAVLQSARAVGATRARIYDAGPEALVAWDYDRLIQAAADSHEWNQLLFGALLDRVPEIQPTRARVPIEAKWRAGPRARRNSKLKAVVSRLTCLTSGPIVIALAGTPATVFPLQLALRQLPYVPPPPDEFDAPMDMATRAGLTVACGDDPFGAALAALLPCLAPVTAVEAYATLRERALRRYPRAPRQIVTANGHWDPSFTLWAAEKREEGASFEILQHGGHHGADRWSETEDHDLKVADRYFSWGWTKPAHDNIVPMAALKLSRLTPNLSYDPQGFILAVYDAAYPYSYRMYSLPVAGQRRKDNALQIELLRALPDDLRQFVRLRLHAIDDGFGFRRDLEAAGLAALIDRRKIALRQALRSARLCLVAANSTPILEVLAFDFPCCLYWDPDLSELRPEAQPYYETLAAAGILHRNPGAAAAHIATIARDVMGWWRSETVQRARAQFAERFARRSDHWLSDWKRALSLAPPAGAKTERRPGYAGIGGE